MTTAHMNTPEASQAEPAVGIRVDRPVRPLVWARKDQLQHASTRGGLLCAMYPHTDRRADLQPLYDQAALDAAVAEANRRQNAAWALMAEKLVAAERERWANGAARMLAALDALDRGAAAPGFRGWQNGDGEDVGDEVQDAREALAALASSAGPN